MSLLFFEAFVSPMYLENIACVIYDMFTDEYKIAGG